LITDIQKGVIDTANLILDYNW